MAALRIAIITLAIMLLPCLVMAETFGVWWHVVDHTAYGAPVRYGIEFSYDHGATWEDEVDLGLPDSDACGAKHAQVTIISGHPGALALMRIVSYYTDGQRVPWGVGMYRYMKE